MRGADLITAALLAAVAALVIKDAVRLGFGWGSDGPKSGFFPFWLAVLMLVAVAGIVVQTLTRARGAPFVRREQLGPVLRVLGPAVAFIVATQFIGLYVSGAAYLAVSMRWLGQHAWAMVASVSLGVPLAMFVIFERWFVVPMPKGPLEAWLGY